MQNVGNGSVTKTVLEFLRAKGNATLYTNEVDQKFVIKVALENNISIVDMVNKNIKNIDVDYPLVAWRFN
ncbi:hypothetical protein NST33_17840 [Paenibacillus sp. FSL L8-0435]|uniref:hypothetical protein n=1 Tax=Paenibacillus sp. FSL L8-0435 TaxID=2954618 RepID=UPI0030D8572F